MITITITKRMKKKKIVKFRTHKLYNVRTRFILINQLIRNEQCTKRSTATSKKRIPVLNAVMKLSS
jgi:hypothetical protein